MAIKHYVTYYYPSIFIDEESSKEIADREPDSLNKLTHEAIENDKNCFGIQFHSVEVVGGINGELRGKPFNVTPMVYFGKIYTIEEIKALNEDKKLNILISNMEANKYTKVVKCRTGNFKPILPGNSVINA